MRQAGSQTQILRTRAIQVIDGEGRIRISLTVAPTGAPQIWLLDQQDQRRVEITASSEGSGGLTIADAAGRRRIVLGMPIDGTPGLILSDATGRQRMTLRLFSEGPILRLADSAERPRLSLFLSRDGAPGLEAVGCSRAGADGTFCRYHRRAEALACRCRRADSNPAPGFGSRSPGAQLV